MYRDDHWNENRESPHERPYVDEDLINCVGDPHEIQNHRENQDCARREREEQRHDYLETITERNCSRSKLNARFLPEHGKPN